MADTHAPVEEIQLSAAAPPADESPIESATARTRFDLSQSNPSRGLVRRFAVCDDGRLHVMESSRRRERRFQIGLAFLDLAAHGAGGEKAGLAAEDLSPA